MMGMERGLVQNDKINNKCTPPSPHTYFYVRIFPYDMFIFSISYKNSSYMLLLFICSYWIKIWSLMKLSARMNFMTVILIVWHTYIERVARIHEIEQLTFKYIKSTFPLILIWDQFCNSNNIPFCSIFIRYYHQF